MAVSKWFLIPGFVLFLPCLHLEAAEYQVKAEKSVFSVITHKAGFASALAHDHFVYPPAYETVLSTDGRNGEALRFSLSFLVENLVVDDKAAEEKWFERIKAVGIKQEAFPSVSDSDRQKIRDSMLSPDQLNAGKHPSITATLKDLREKQSTRGTVVFSHVADIALTIRGKTVTKPFQVNVDKGAETLRVEGVGSFRFTEFNIEPFAAFLGAVKNQDEFDAYIQIEALKK